MAKEYLSSKGVPFEAIDVSASSQALESFISLTGVRATPVIEIGAELVHGWDRGKVERLLHPTNREVRE